MTLPRVRQAFFDFGAEKLLDIVTRTVMLKQRSGLVRINRLDAPAAAAAVQTYRPRPARHRATFAGQEPIAPRRAVQPCVLEAKVAAVKPGGPSVAVSVS
jgi:hypothetical protein